MEDEYRDEQQEEFGEFDEGDMLVGEIRDKPMDHRGCLGQGGRFGLMPNSIGNFGNQFQGQDKWNQHGGNGRGN